MKKLMVFFLIGVFMVAFAQAGDENHPKTMKGDKALLFTINGLGYFGVEGNQAGMSPLMLYMTTDLGEGFDGMDFSDLDVSAPVAKGFGFLYYFGDNTALRMGLNYQSATVKQEFNDEEDGFDGETSVTLSTMGIAPGIQYHLVNTNALTIYTGAEFFYASGKLSMKEEGDDDESEASLNFSGFGAAGLLGAQFYPFKNVSFGAEYKLGYSSLSSSMKMESGRNKDESDGPSISMLGITTWAVTLGFHF